MFDVPLTNLATASYEAGPVLPPANGFLLFSDQAPQENTAIAPSSPANSNSVSRLIPCSLPAELAGLPVFRVGDEEVVFVAHILTRVLVCQCRANRHFGLFKDKKFGMFRRMIDTSEWRLSTHMSDDYETYRKDYSMLRFKDSSAAITVEGLLKWHATKMPIFVDKEAAKCRLGCVDKKCTCPA